MLTGLTTTRVDVGPMSRRWPQRRMDICPTSTRVVVLSIELDSIVGILHYDFTCIITFQVNDMATIEVKDIIAGPEWFDWDVQKLVIQAIDAKLPICQVPYGLDTKQYKNASYVLERCRTTRYTVRTGWITKLPHKSLSAPEHRLLFTYPPHVPNAPSNPLIVPKNKQEFDDVYTLYEQTGAPIRPYSL